MKIGVLVSDPFIGLLFYPVRTSVTFRTLGHDVCAYTWTRSGQTPGLLGSLEDAGVEVVYRPELQYTGSKGFLGLLQASKTKDTLKSLDMLLTHGPMGAWQLRDTVKKGGVRIAMINSMGHDRRSFWKPVIGAVILNRCCDKVGALCHLEGQRLREAGVRAEKLVVIHNPVDWRSLSKINADRDRVVQEFNLPRERRYVGCMASFQPRKRQDLLLQAFAALAQEFRDVDLVFCGNGAELPACRELSRRLGIEDRTHFLGQVPNADALRLTSSLDAFALVTNAETFGYSFVEPLVFSKPVLATRIGIGWEMERAGVAVVVPPDDERAVVVGLRRILDQGAEVERMKARGPAFVREHFDTEIIARKLISLARAE